MNQTRHKLSDSEFAAIVRLDHGVVNAILAGLTVADLENQDTELARHWSYLTSKIAELQPNVNRVQLLLDKAIEQ